MFLTPVSAGQLGLVSLGSTVLGSGPLRVLGAAAGRSCLSQGDGRSARGQPDISPLLMSSPVGPGASWGSHQFIHQEG